MKVHPTVRVAAYAISLVIIELTIASCAPSSSRLNQLRVGMTREDVTRTLGRPRSTTAQGGSEMLIYQFTDKPFGDGMIFPGMYYVQLSGGRVVGWNRDEEKDRADRERAYRMNAAALAPPQRVQVEHSGYVHHDVTGNVYHYGN